MSATNYLMLVCIDGIADPEADATIEREIDPWLAEMDGRGVRIWGHPLEETARARTVSVRDGETLVADGPWAETKELVAGFDILRCADLDEAIEVAAKHPLARFGTLELRPFGDCPAQTTPLEWPSAEQIAGPPRGKQRFMLLLAVDGVAEDEKVEAGIMREGALWWRLARTQGGLFATSLAGLESATTLRIRDGETVLSDGPFAETKEFIAGLCVLDLDSIEQAIELAALHPLAHFHRVEVRAFSTEWDDRHGG